MQDIGVLKNGGLKAAYAIRATDLLRRDAACAGTFRDHLARQRDQFPAVLNGVDQGIEAADQEDVDAEVMIFGQ